MSERDWMKCFGCGHGTDIKPNEPFLEIQFDTHNSPVFTAPIIVRGPREKQNVKIYACPKCGTLKIDVQPDIIA